MLAIRQPSEHDKLLHTSPITRRARRDSIGSQQQEQVLDVFRRPYKDGSATVDSWMKKVETPLSLEDEYGMRSSRRKTWSSRLKKSGKSGDPELSAILDERAQQHEDGENQGDNRTEDDADNEGYSEVDDSDNMKDHRHSSSRTEAAGKRERHGATAIDTTRGASSDSRPGRHHLRTNSSATFLLHFRKASTLSESEADSSPIAYRRRGPRARTQQTGVPASTPTTPPRLINPFGKESAPDLTDLARSIDETALLSSSFTTHLGRNRTCDSNIHEAMNRLLLERMQMMETSMKGIMDIMKKERWGR